MQAVLKIYYGFLVTYRIIFAKENVTFDLSGYLNIIDLR